MLQGTSAMLNEARKPVNNPSLRATISDGLYISPAPAVNANHFEITASLIYGDYLITLGSGGTPGVTNAVYGDVIRTFTLNGSSMIIEGRTSDFSTTGNFYQFGPTVILSGFYGTGISIDIAVSPNGLTWSRRIIQMASPGTSIINWSGAFVGLNEFYFLNSLGNTSSLNPPIGQAIANSVAVYKANVQGNTAGSTPLIYPAIYVAEAHLTQNKYNLNAVRHNGYDYLIFPYYKYLPVTGSSGYRLSTLGLKILKTDGLNVYEESELISPIPNSTANNVDRNIYYSPIVRGKSSFYLALAYADNDQNIYDPATRIAAFQLDAFLFSGTARTSIQLYYSNDLLNWAAIDTGISLSGAHSELSFLTTYQPLKYLPLAGGVTKDIEFVLPGASFAVNIPTSTPETESIPGFQPVAQQSYYGFKGQSRAGWQAEIISYSQDSSGRATLQLGNLK